MSETAEDIITRLADAHFPWLRKVCHDCEGKGVMGRCEEKVHWFPELHVGSLCSADGTLILTTPCPVCHGAKWRPRLDIPLGEALERLGRPLDLLIRWRDHIDIKHLTAEDLHLAFWQAAEECRASS